MAAVFQEVARRSLSYSLSRVLPRSAGASGASSGVRSLHCGQPRRLADKSYQFVVCGGGPGGLAVAASLGRRFGPGQLAVIEPSTVR